MAKATVRNSRISHCAQLLAADPLQTIRWDVILQPKINTIYLAFFMSDTWLRLIQSFSLKKKEKTL